MDWWENISIGELKFTGLPAVHGAGRGITDENNTLWCSWAILSSSENILFVGDTGYSPTIFNRIGEKFHGFDIAILPIGGYKPRSSQGITHVTPEDAVKIGLEVKAKVVVAGHWGTIELSDEPHWEPPKRFFEAGIKAKYLKEQIWIMKIGETRALQN